MLQRVYGEKLQIFLKFHMESENSVVDQFAGKSCCFFLVHLENDFYLLQSPTQSWQNSLGSFDYFEASRFSFSWRALFGLFYPKIIFNILKGFLCIY